MSTNTDPSEAWHKKRKFVSFVCDTCRAHGRAYAIIKGKKICRKCFYKGSKQNGTKK